MNAPFVWIDCPAWELDFFGLPHRIPWPVEAVTEDAAKQQFEAAQLLRGIELLEEHDPAAAAPWTRFADAASYIQELTEAIQESEYVQAAELLAKVEQAHPGSPFALFHRAFLERQNGRDDKALALYQAAAEKAPRLGFIWSHLGVMLGEAGRHAEAIEAFKKALASNPNDQMALEGLVQLRAGVKLFKDPKDPKSVVYLPVEQYRNMAAQQIEQIAKDPDQLLNFGEFQLREGHAPEVALQALEKARDLRPDDVRTLVALGNGYRITGQHPRAIQTLHRVTELAPQDARGYFHLAQACNAAGDKDGETSALNRVLELDPNFQPAIAIHHGLEPGKVNPGIEGRIAAFAEARNSWMAWLIASSLARDRGDLAAAQQRAERAYAINPDAEDVLLHYSSILTDTKDAARLEDAIEPAVRRGKFSKRLDWNYAQALRQLGRTNEAIALLRDAAAARDAQADLKQAAAITIDFWNGLLAEGGIRAEAHRGGALRRPLLLALDDGDGGVILPGGKPLPAEHRFPFRTNGTGETEARVRIQQGQSGGDPGPRALGAFTVRGIKPASTGPTTIECVAGATNDGTLRFGAMQEGRKLQVAWTAPA